MNVQISARRHTQRNPVVGRRSPSDVARGEPELTPNGERCPVDFPQQHMATVKAPATNYG